MFTKLEFCLNIRIFIIKFEFTGVVIIIIRKKAEKELYAF